MALTFGGATSDRVDHGTGASLTDLSAFTAWQWCYPTVQTENRRFWAKGAAGAGKASQWAFGNANDVELNVSRATTEARAETSNGLATNTWHFIMWTYDETDGPRIFLGTLASLLAEASYVARDVGSGSTTSDSSAGMFVGNRFSASPSSAFEGRIASFGYLNRRLTLEEGQTLQFRPRVLSGTVLLTQYGYNGTSTQPDWSGTGNAGTVTGATVDDHVPLPFRRGHAMAASYRTFRRFLLTRF